MFKPYQEWDGWNKAFVAVMVVNTFILYFNSPLNWIVIIFYTWALIHLTLISTKKEIKGRGYYY